MSTFASTTAVRKFPVIGETRDVENVYWYVRDIRPTKHGFDLLFGSPVLSRPKRGLYNGGMPRLIASEPLIEFWHANRMKHDGFLFDLPAGRTTLKRLRRRMGFNFNDDWLGWWQQRIDDLNTLTPRAFAKKHDVSKDVASDKRFKLLGRRARLEGWWRQPEHLEVLRRDITLREMGLRLGISTSQVFRLKARTLNL